MSSKSYKEWPFYPEEVKIYNKELSQNVTYTAEDIDQLRTIKCKGVVSAVSNMTRNVQQYTDTHRRYYRRRIFFFGMYARRSLTSATWFSVDRRGTIRMHAWSSAGMAA